ncbi:MAG: ATP phosphoribosyltransferase [bacterium]
MNNFTRGVSGLPRLVISDGSMEKVILDLLKSAGFILPEIRSRQKKILLDSQILESITLMRPQMSPTYAEKGYFDIIICGQDHIVNTGAKLKTILEMPVARQTKQAVKIVLAVAKVSGFRSIADLPQGCILATEYVEMAERYLASKGRSDIRVIRSYGGTEQMISLGASAIIDVTETGSSLVANGLVIIDTLMTSNTVIAANLDSYADPQLRPLIDLFACIIKGAWDADQYVRMEANIPDSLIEKAASIMGGMKSPTIGPLLMPGWAALTAYIPKEKQHEVSFLLTQLGVKDICTSSVDVMMGID